MKSKFYTLLYIGVATILSSCTGGLVFDQYEHTPVAGWEKNDALEFDISPLEKPGNYQKELGLRVTGAYPFMKLTLIVETKKWGKGDKPSEYTAVVDTVQCDLMDKNGVTKGQGISSFQYNMPFAINKYQEGDSLHVEIRHDMKREILPGISDVGLKMSLLDQ